MFISCKMLFKLLKSNEKISAKTDFVCVLDEKLALNTGTFKRLEIVCRLVFSGNFLNSFISTITFLNLDNSCFVRVKFFSKLIESITFIMVQFWFCLFKKSIACCSSNDCASSEYMPGKSVTTHCLFLSKVCILVWLWFVSPCQLPVLLLLEVSVLNRVVLPVFGFPTKIMFCVLIVPPCCFVWLQRFVLQVCATSTQVCCLQNKQLFLIWKRLLVCTLLLQFLNQVRLLFFGICYLNLFLWFLQFGVALNQIKCKIFDFVVNLFSRYIISLLVGFCCGCFLFDVLS